MIRGGIKIHWFKLLAAMMGFLLVTAFSVHAQSEDEAPPPAAVEEEPAETADKPEEKPAETADKPEEEPAETADKPEEKPAETADKPAGDAQLPAAADQKPAGDAQQPATADQKPAGDARQVPRAPALAKLAVLQLHQSGVLDSEFGEIQSRLLGELKASGKFELLPDTGMAEALSGLNLQPGECREPDCAAKIGQALGAEKVIVGSIVNVSEDQWMFSGVLVDSASGKVERRVSFEHQGSVFLLKREPITLFAEQLAGVKVPSVAGETPPLTIPEKVEEKEEKGLMPWWAWLLIGLGVAALALGGGGDSGGSGSSSSGGSSGGAVVISW